MKKPEKKIVDFINSHHVLTLATSNQNIPWCANCFYVFLEEENILVFTSDDKTKHINDVRLNANVAGSIVLETKTVGKIQGIQFLGIMEKPEAILAKKSKKAYLKRFPYAALMNTSLWVLKLNYIKMTDNRLGFGEKLIWKK
ncbi:MAG: pyridoxamine 5'-phosphate oxidase family protein [Mariniphaga sp.]|nr:pyridoxamine 5'-phosphate oxidase family protein [Mariniphaga sp.]